MQFDILNKNLEWVGVMDCFKSAIWTPRYYDVGDFELYVSASKESLDLLQMDYYISRDDDDMICVIEKPNIVTDDDGGKFLICTGRSIQNLLSRRIIWQQTNLNGTVEDCIRRLIDENIINPEIPERRIPGFIMAPKQGYAEHMEMQVTGDNLLDVVTKLCKAYGYGFKVTLDNNKQFVFQLYRGTDRSYNQAENPYVIFSPDFDNLLTVDYSADKSNYKNVALVAGEGEGTARKTAIVGDASGLKRYEYFVDARDLSTNNGEISEDTYYVQLTERGIENLSTLGIQELFSGSIAPDVNYEYKLDYNLGDVVQIENEFGISAAPRIIEIIECEDYNGYSLTPTFDSQEVA